MGPLPPDLAEVMSCSQLSDETDYWYLLVSSGILISTARVYSQVDISAVNDKCTRIHQNGGIWIGPLVQPKLELTNGDVNIKIFVPDGFRLEGNKIWLLLLVNDLEGW